jgi:integrase
LNKPFAELLFNTDLILCDEDEVTEAYTSIIKASSPSNQGYLSNRIIAFHQFAKDYYVADPIWSEVPLVKLGVKVSPGYIDEKSYLETLKLLYANARGQADALYQALLLIFAYRFGLRSKEVFGILRKDLKSDDELMWVLVRSNYVRALKNRQSARRVPLLFELSRLENTIIKRGLAEAEAEFSEDVDKPLFYYQGKPLDRFQRKHISIQVSQALKLVTGNHHTTLHHCRHSAANRIALAFIKPKLKAWKGADTISGVSNILLGHQMITKRSSWVTARFLGQGVLETQFRSYMHFLPEWVERRFRALKKKDEEYILTSKAVTHLSMLKRASRVDYSLLTLTPHTQTIITPVVMLKLFKLIAIGKSIEWMAEHMDIPTQKVISIHEVLKKQLSLVTVNNKQVTVREFFSGFTQTVWDRLTNSVSHFELDASNLDFVYSLKDKCGSPSIMIGATRQIVLWNSAHFRIFRALAALFKLSEADYKVFVSVKDNKNINRYLKLLNLDGEFRENYQVDAILHKGSYVKPRANIVADSISKKSKTSFELVTILLILLSIIGVI